MAREADRGCLDRLAAMKLPSFTSDSTVSVHFLSPSLSLSCFADVPKRDAAAQVYGTVVSCG